MGKHAMILLSIITPFWFRNSVCFKSEENNTHLILSKSWFSYNIGAGKALDLGPVWCWELHFVVDQPLNYCM